MSLMTNLKSIKRYLFTYVLFSYIFELGKKGGFQLFSVFQEDRVVYPSYLSKGKLCKNSK